jgi:hypothetical protein
MGHPMLLNTQKYLETKLGNKLGLPTYQLTYLHTFVNFSKWACKCDWELGLWSLMGTL